MLTLTDFDFDLPEERIALRPVFPRENAKLLHVTPGRSPELSDRTVADLPGLLRPGDALVLNDTRVIPARLFGVRHREGGVGAQIEVTLHKYVDGTRWMAFAKPAKRLKHGDTISFGREDNPLEAVVTETLGLGEVALAFHCAETEFTRRLIDIGTMPLPPYIASKREIDDQDQSDYQTVYGEKEGSVAAPTAGLHLTRALLETLENKGVLLPKVTLHVGAGTFLPVKTENISEHAMHAEHGLIDQETADLLNRVRAEGGRIIASGTTSLRLLESASDENGRIQPFNNDTSIFITPGHVFRGTDALFTNFHLPKSTLFMLVSAFSGLETMKAAYAHAISNAYRFFSYGDASFLERAP